MSAASAQPYLWQQADIAALAGILKEHGVAADLSDPGTGKTFKALFAAKRLGLRVAVVCPKAIRPAWAEAAAKVGVEVVHITNYERLRTGRTSLGFWVSKREFRWTVPADCLLILDEVHRTKGTKTQNCRMAMAIRDCGVRALLLSATAAENPLEMRAIGYLLCLHNGRDFYRWCEDNHCRPGYFGGLQYKGGVDGLVAIHRQMRPRVVRTRIVDLGDQFPANRIETLPLEIDDADALDKAILAELEALASGAETELVAGLRARQIAEYLKAKAIAQRIGDLVAEGQSVAVFAGFRQTLDALLPTALDLNGCDIPCVIRGGQSDLERQGDRTRVVLCMIQAGGVGLSLHDIHGRFPRVALICPTYSATELRQALGRIHRASAKSPAQQLIVFAAGSIEEQVRARVEAKLANIDTLNDGDLAFTFPAKAEENLRLFSKRQRKEAVGAA